MSGVRLYGYWRSSATWRVRIGLQLKGLPYDYVPVHLVKSGGEQNSAAHLRRNPMAQVPVLSWSDDSGTVHRLTQSLAILEWLEETWTAGARLLPADPFARARCRQLAEVVNAGIQPFQNLWLTKQVNDAGADGRDLGRRAIVKGLDALEAELEIASRLPEAARPGAWMVGDQPSLADICLIPQLYNARRFELRVERWPRLARVDQVASGHVAFKAAHPDNQPDATP